MRTSLLLLALLAICFQFQAHAAASVGPLVKHFNSLLKWTRSASSTSHSVGNVLQFEDGYLVETVVKGNELGIVPYKMDVSPDGELYALDSVNGNIVRITPPLSQYSRARLIAGSFQGHTGHVDGKPSEARFNHPNGVTMDDKGNIYVADISNLAIRKIGEAGVTTIAGGKSNIAGYRDGPSEDAQFSNDFDVIYVRPTCSLLVVDRGNAALRQISLNQEDCDYHYSSFSTLGFGSFIDILMIFGAIMVGYVACFLQQGFGSNIFSVTRRHVEAEEEQQLIKEKSPVVETVKEEPEAVWPSFGQLVWDLSKLALEALGTIFTLLNPLQVRHKSSKPGLTPLKDSLIMPEDEVDPPLVQKLRTPAPLYETKQIHTQHTSDKFSDVKPAKLGSSSLKDPLLSSKHLSSKRHEHSEPYGSAEVPQHVQARSKSQKERTKHCRQEKSREANFDATGVEPKHVEAKGVNYEDTRYKLYDIRDKYEGLYCYK